MMKRLQPAFFVALFCTLFWMSACNGSDNSAPPPVKIDSVETVFEQPDTVLFWVVDEYKKTMTQVYKDTTAITDPQSVINGINSLFKEIPLKFDRLSNDTVYASIDSTSKFSDDMGSSGAMQYLATVVSNLTTLKNVEYVRLRFRPGSHATPGVYSRKTLDSYTIQPAAEDNQ